MKVGDLVKYIGSYPKLIGKTGKILKISDHVGVSWNDLITGHELGIKNCLPRTGWWVLANSIELISSVTEPSYFEVFN